MSHGTQYINVSWKESGYPTDLLIIPGFSLQGFDMMQIKKVFLVYKG